MTLEEEFETLKGDYIQKSQAHLHELQHLQMNDFNQVTTTVDVVLTQHAASMSFLSLSIFIQDHKRKW